MILKSNSALLKHMGAVALAFFALLDAAFAAFAFQWSDSDGIVHVTHEPPVMGVMFVQIFVPDPISWNHPPEMRAEIAPESTASTQNLFRSASQSVYWILPGGLDYGYAVAITEDLAITNCRVMVNAGNEAIIGSPDSDKTARVEIVAADFVADRCVIMTRDLRLKPVAGIRRFDSLEIGETVYAIDNPRRFDRKLSDGLVSGRRVISDRRLLQTTVSIAPSSSGGGLFDSRGNLVAITTSYLRGIRIINLAIPAEDFWR